MRMYGKWAEVCGNQAATNEDGSEDENEEEYEQEDEEDY